MTTAYLNLPPHARPPTSTGASSPPADESSSGPGTPASGISSLSTTAIKDGHEGHHPVINFDVAAERVARLGGIGTPPNVGYFDRDRTLAATAPTPTAASVMSDGPPTPEGDTYGANSTQAKRETMAAAIARRNLANSQTTQLQQQLQPPSEGSGVSSRMGDSPASTQTTPSVAEARNTAKMIDGMTYDEGVVDTTAEGITPRHETVGVKVNDEDTDMKDD